MSDQNNIIEAKVRDTKKKSELNKLRSDGFVPGILYGDIEKNISLSIKKTTLDHFLKTTNFKSKVVKITIEGKEFEVLPRDVEFDNLSNQPIHVDFQKLSANTNAKANTGTILKKRNKRRRKMTKSYKRTQVVQIAFSWAHIEIMFSIIQCH